MARTGICSPSASEATAGVACYLETGTQSNIDLYSSHGFEVAGSVERDGFTLTAMIRSPR